MTDIGFRDNRERQIDHLRVPLAQPWFDAREPEAARRVIESRWVIFGPKVEEFEARFAAMFGVRHAIAVNSGSSALLVAMAVLGVGRDDEIIVPDMTFVSTASAALFLGARPRFVDIELDWYGMDPGRVEAAVTRRTKAIVPVHYAGQACELGPILALADHHGIAVLEDSAESHLARYCGGRFTGTLGRMGIFSFTPSKPMTTGEGGMIVTDDDVLAERCRRFRNFGDAGKFQWIELGFNFRMPEVSAAVGIHQLEKLAETVHRRRAIAHRYTEALSGLSRVIPPRVRQLEDHNFQLYTLRVDTAGLGFDRDGVIERLGARGVSARLYYPTLHTQPVFRACGPFDDAAFRNAMAYARSAVSLPIFPTLTDEQQDYVISCVREILTEQ